MGHGIAYVAAAAGCSVTLTDSSAEALVRAAGRIEALVDQGIARLKISKGDRASVLGRLRREPALAQAVALADVVIEAVIEDLEIKRALFADLERHAPLHAVLASNTSSLSITRIAEAVGDAGRVVGVHFFNPVPVMKLVEIVRHERAAGDIVDRVTAFARVLGKEPIVVNDSPGFASSRLGVLLGLEAMRMLEQGVASAEDIDRAMELGYNHPMGPLKLSDLVGLDVRLAIADHLHRELRLAQFAPPAILRDKVAKGELGKKTGKGFYVWSG
jgi:3-hydroxybutyryl-CoA dehydrogenase